MKKRIAITGAYGQLGRCLKAVSSHFKDFDYFFLDSQECNITSRDSVSKSFSSIVPDYVINTAAFTAVDLAETELVKAMELNAYALRNITAICGKAKIIHLSTDYVYNENQSIPLKEDMPVHPKSNYAKSKLLGENILKSSGKAGMIIRTSWLYSEFGKNFVKTMLDLSKLRKEISVVDDQVGSPTYAIDLATCILSIIDMDSKGLVVPDQWNTIYNYCNTGRVSWYELAMAIFSFAKIEMSITPVPSVLYRTPARRPQWSVLDTTKIVEAFGLEINGWNVSLEKCIRHLVN